MRSGLVEQVRNLREELNWYYRQIDLQEIRSEKLSTQRIESLRQRSRQYEDQLVKTLDDLRATDQEFTALQNAATKGKIPQFGGSDCLSCPRLTSTRNHAQRFG